MTLQESPPETSSVNLCSDRDLNIEDAAIVAEGQRVIAISASVHASIAAAHERMLKCINDGRHIYGVTTGFGPLADRSIAAKDLARLQANLVHHLASGVEPMFDWATARSILVARLVSISKGVSGASPEAVDALLSVLSSGLAPLVPSRGTVGASGDLTPLAHVALSLQGKAGFLTESGKPLPAEEAFSWMGRAPITLVARDGLALVNGTSAMTGVAVLNADRAARIAAWAIALTAALGEVLAVRTEAWDVAFAEVRPHPGQLRVTRALNDAVRTGRRADTRRLAVDGMSGRVRSPQDAYTLRCAPQVIGAALDALDWHRLVVTRELNSASDNPIFPEALVPALHGGNFMGSHIALASDTCSAAVLSLASLGERQIARVTDERLNEGLPAFLSGGPPGLTSGLMGAQVTATALLAEMRTRAVPASSQSISTNGANQDVVSMGTTAARQTAQHLSDFALILAILSLAVSQAMHITGEEEYSDQAKSIAEAVRRHAPPLQEDRPLAAEIAALADMFLLDREIFFATLGPSAAETV
ncbi:MAG: aromatic amino acid ammonia-lyase [Pseudomonadota bacterium]